MMQPVIEIKKLTKDYGYGRGIFDVDLTVYKGEMVGFVGTNGSGKTTTIRNILGFLRPTKGRGIRPRAGGVDALERDRQKGSAMCPEKSLFPTFPRGRNFSRARRAFWAWKAWNTPIC